MKVEFFSNVEVCVSNTAVGEESEGIAFPDEAHS